MIVAMIAVGVVQASIDQIIDMVAVRNRFVAAAGTMHVSALRASRDPRGALRGVRGIDRQRMLVVVIAVGVMEMAFVQVIRVSVVLDRGVAAAGAVDVFGMAMRFMVAHHWSPIKQRGLENNNVKNAGAKVFYV